MRYWRSSWRSRTHSAVVPRRCCSHRLPSMRSHGRAASRCSSYSATYPVHPNAIACKQNTMLPTVKLVNTLHFFQYFLPITLFCTAFRFPVSLHAHVAPAQEGIGSCSTGRHRFQVVTKTQDSLISTSISLYENFAPWIDYFSRLIFYFRFSQLERKNSCGR